jgi:hypothetical protein
MVERLSLNAQLSTLKLEEQLPAGWGFRQTLDGAFFLDLDLWSFRSREFLSAEADSDLPYRESLAG